MVEIPRQPLISIHSDTWNNLDALLKKVFRWLCTIFLPAANTHCLTATHTQNPRPSYWAALLWNRLMGIKVYDAILQLMELMHLYTTWKVRKMDSPSWSLIQKILNIGWYSGKRRTILAECRRTSGQNSKTERYCAQIESGRNIAQNKGQNIKAGELKVPAQSILFLAVKKANSKN